MSWEFGCCSICRHRLDWLGIDSGRISETQMRRRFGSYQARLKGYEAATAALG